MKKRLATIFLSLTMAITLLPIPGVQAATLTKTNIDQSSISLQSKVKDAIDKSFIYDNKNLPENLKVLIPKGLEEKVIVKHIGTVDIIILPKGEHFPTTPPESQQISNSVVSNSVPTRAGVMFQDFNSKLQVLVRGVEDHLDSFGKHFNINVQTRNGSDLNDFHIKFKSKALFSDTYYWQMSDSVSGAEREIVGYGAQAEAAYGAEIGVLSEIAAVSGEEAESLAAGGGSVIIELLLLLLL